MPKGIPDAAPVAGEEVPCCALVETPACVVAVIPVELRWLWTGELLRYATVTMAMSATAPATTTAVVAKSHRHDTRYRGRRRTRVRAACGGGHWWTPLRTGLTFGCW